MQHPNAATLAAAVKGTVRAELTSVVDWLRYSTSVLSQADLCYGHGTVDAWDEAIALLAGALSLPVDRLDVLLGAHVTQAESAVLASLLQRRVVDREPVPYLVGQAPYCGITLQVTPDVLIPRSPIGHLLEQGLQPWLRVAPERILDLCAGSGALGIVAALAFQGTSVLLTDISSRALAVARDNVRRQRLDERVAVSAGDLWAAVPPASTFDLIVTNPPYVPAESMARLPREYRHEPVNALEAEDEGMAIVHRILAGAADYLTPDGLLVLEVGEIEAQVDAAYSHLPLVWLELPDDAHGVAVIDRAGLLAR